MLLSSNNGLPGIAWPSMFFGADAEILALLFQLQLSERWNPQAMKAAQELQLAALLEHAERTVPFYAARLKPLGGASAAVHANRWQEIPLLTRAQLREHAKDLRSDSYPREHGRVQLKKTSGSTGEPVEVLRTDVTQRIWETILLREHFWNGRDAAQANAIIRARTPDAPPPNGVTLKSWGHPYDRLWRTGSSHLLDLHSDIRQQADWLRRVRPAYLLTYSTAAEALVNEFANDDNPPPIREISCIGETVPASLAQRCREILGARISANYSSQELGYLALLCPECSQYHVQSESVLLEVLDDSGQPCGPGAVGRVVVTDLHNFAMPLIRYELGDYAEVGAECSGGRTLPTLRRIVGRTRNMIVHPDGRRNWPLTDLWRLNEIAPIRQYRIIQHSREDVEVHLVPDIDLSAEQYERLTLYFQQVLRGSFKLRFTCHRQRLERAPGGKFEEFVSFAK